MPDVFDFSSEESTDETGSLSDPKLSAARPKRTKKEVQVTNTAHGFLNMYWNVICSMLNQQID